MRHLSKYAEWKPIPELVKDYEDLIYQKYNIKDYNDNRIIVVDDKIHYLTGPFVNKGNLTNIIYHVVMGNMIHSSHEPSLRRAIKNWIDENSK
jgi:hypothetical protein